MAYAATTEVEFDKSIAEIMALIKRAGAARIGQFEGDADYALQFEMDGRLIRFRVPLPTLEEMPFKDGRGAVLDKDQRAARLIQAKRQRGRALLLTIKAKIESIESGIETFEQAFLAHVVMADGATVYERIGERIAVEYQTGRPDAVAGLLAAPK